MANLLSNPVLWKDDAGNSPPSYWNGTSYVFNTGGVGEGTQYIELITIAPAASTCSGTMHNLAPCTGSTPGSDIVQLLDLNHSPSSPYYSNGTDMQSVGSWTVSAGTLAGMEKLQFIADSQFVTSYAYDFTLTPTVTPPIPTPSEVRLRWTDDGGHNWSNFMSSPMGDIGQTANRVIFRRLGSTRESTGLDRIFEISSDAYTQTCLVGASFIDG